MIDLNTPAARPGPRHLTADETDEAIVARITGGEPALFEVLMRRHNQRIYRAIRAVMRRDEDCEDVMQQAYINAFRYLGQFQGQARFSTWLTRIAVNEAIQRIRRAERRPEAPLADDSTGGAAGEAASPEHAAYARQIGGMIEAAVDALPEPYRVVFALREVEGLSTAETAESLALNEHTVKTRLHRAKVQLRRELSARLGGVSADVYAFHLSRCDRVVGHVMQHLGLRR